MARIVNIDIVIDPESTDEPYIPKCTVCGETATKRVLNEHDEPLGNYCAEHVEAAWQEAQDEEERTHEGTIHDPIQE